MKIYIILDGYTAKLIDRQTEKLTDRHTYKLTDRRKVNGQIKEEQIGIKWVVQHLKVMCNFQYLNHDLSRKPCLWILTCL